MTNILGLVQLGGLLSIIFTVLKWLHIVNWAWQWVLAPIWMAILFIVCIFVFGTVQNKVEKVVELPDTSGIFGSITLFLTVLKVLHILNCSWLWVFAPIWIPVLMYLYSLAADLFQDKILYPLEMRNYTYLWGLAALVLLILKLLGIIHWSWLWIFSPVWIPVLLTLALFAVYQIEELMSYRK